MNDYPPCLVLALTCPKAQTELQQCYRRAGWDVYPAQGGAQLRRLARLLEADLVLLDLALDGESGWLTCAKMRRELTDLRIILLGEDTPRNHRLAMFVGASGLMSREHAGHTSHRPLPVAA